MNLKRYKSGAAVALVLASMLLQGCKDAEYSAIDNSVYIAETADGTTMKKVTIAENGGAASFSVRTAKPLTQDASVTIGVSQDILDAFNQRNGTNYELLPADYYTLSATELPIKTGNVSSDMVNLNIKPLSTEMVQSGKKYAVPVSVLSSTTGLPLLDVKKTMLYACDQTIVTKALYLGHNSFGKVTFPSPLNTNTWTVEMRIKCDDIRKEFNNQSFLQLSSDGGEGKGFLYCRYEGDVIQFKINGHNGMNVNVTPVSNHWYHVAIVCENGQVRLYLNGKLNNTVDDSAFKTMAAFKYVNFSFGDNVYQRSNTFYSEVRIWTKVLQQSQIENNMYSVDKGSAGLPAYWKCDEGKGTTVHDYTGHGYDFTIEHNGEPQFGWVGVRSDSDTN